MIVTLAAICIIAYIIRTIRMGLYYVFLWQLREYRRDRMWAHLHTPTGKKLLLGKLEKGKWLAFVLFLFSIPIIWLLWIAEAAFYLRELLSKGWLRPVLTIKAGVLCLGVVLIGIIVPFLPGTVFGFLLVAPFIDRLLFFLVSGMVGVLGIGSAVWKDWMMRRAQAKREQFPNLHVVGITGSYGKTTTKEYLATILSQRYRVIKTPASKNADIGIAQWLLRDLDEQAQVAVVEMGILKRGELRRICAMARPSVGIITGIGNQHVELFGSVRAIKEAKYELLAALPKDGIAVCNGASEGAIELAVRAKREGMKQVIVTKSVPVQATKTGVRFSLTREGKTYSFRAAVLGVQAVENIILAIQTALAMGLTMKHIQQGVAAIRPVAETMTPYTDDRGIWYVDDTFNASEQGVLAGLSYLKLFSGKKVLVLTPLIELGDEGEAVHRRLGKAAGAICDQVVFTNPNYYAAFRSGVAEVAKTKTDVRILSAAEAIDQIQSLPVKDTVVLFEGKEAGKILHRVDHLHPYDF